VPELPCATDSYVLLVGGRVVAQGPVPVAVAQTAFAVGSTALACPSGARTESTLPFILHDVNDPAGAKAITGTPPIATFLAGAIAGCLVSALYVGVATLLRKRRAQIVSRGLPGVISPKRQVSGNASMRKGATEGALNTPSELALCLRQESSGQHASNAGTASCGATRLGLCGTSAPPTSHSLL